MTETRRAGLSRRTALKAAGAAAAGAAALGPLPPMARGAPLLAAQLAYPLDQYESIVNRPVAVRQVYEWPNLSNPQIYANVANGLNAFQFDYGIPPDQIQVVVQAYGTANLAMYDDSIWQRYRLGEMWGVTDPLTGAPATRNVWFPSQNPPLASPPDDRGNPYYADQQIEGLQRRGVLFLI